MRAKKTVKTSVAVQWSPVPTPFVATELNRECEDPRVVLVVDLGKTVRYEVRLTRDEADKIARDLRKRVMEIEASPILDSAQNE